jgi:hypothetical protein
MDQPEDPIVSDDSPISPQRIGFMAGQIEVPEDFDRMHHREIERLFDGNE